jgi:hypothetical protein
MPHRPVVTHWSLPPQHAGYPTRTGRGDGWPELGGAGPRPGPHIPGLDPHWHSGGRPEHVGLPVQRIPRWGFMVSRDPGRPMPRSWGRLFNRPRPARREPPPRWR